MCQYITNVDYRYIEEKFFYVLFQNERNSYISTVYIRHVLATDKGFKNISFTAVSDLRFHQNHIGIIQFCYLMNSL